MTRRTRPMRHARTPVSTGPSRRLTRRGVTFGAALGLTLSALPAWAYWTSSVATSASASAEVLKPPAAITASAPSAGVVNLKVTAGPAMGPSADRYKVMRGSSLVCDNLALNATCSDTGAVPGTANTYTVFSRLNNWISQLSTVRSATTPTLGAPVVLGLTDSTDTGTKGDSYTSNTTPSFRGTAEPGATVRLVVDTVLGTVSTVADVAGNWTLTPASAPSVNTTHTVRARVTLNGVTSVDSAAFPLLIDTVKPTTGTATMTCTSGSATGFCRVATVNVPSIADSSPSSGLAGLDYAIGSVASTSPATVSGGTANFTVSGVNGKPTITYQSRDMAANSSTSRTVTTPNFTFDGSAPTVATLSLTNGGQSLGVIERGDTIQIQFADTGAGVSPASICPGTWASTTTTINGQGDVIVTVTDSGSNDLLTIDTSSSCGKAPRIGSIDLGANYVSGGDLTFGAVTGTSSSLAWNAATSTLTITLGRSSGSGSTRTVGTNSLPVMTPDGTITDLVGNAISTSTVSGSSSRF